MRIPFTKAHGARNDFLLTWWNEAPREKLPEAARAICDRYAGVGADGWILVRAAGKSTNEYDGSIRLFNADGSEAEISGNGTRCAAAFLIDAGLKKDEVRLMTGAGLKHLRLIEHDELRYVFEMNMGEPVIREDQLRFSLCVSEGQREVTLVNVGNPQCVVFVDDLSWPWQKLGAEIESNPAFPNRTNVSFVRPIDEHTLDVRFYERGVGETNSSGTGCTGAVAAAIARKVAASPVRVLTPAGPLDLRWERDLYLTGPAEIVAGGEFYFD